jgi:3-carboxy-cis,cis-muconate cycloisomerase
LVILQKNLPTQARRQEGRSLERFPLAKGGSFIEALGQFEKELSDEAALLGYSPKFVDRLLADLKTGLRS